MKKIMLPQVALGIVLTMAGSFMLGERFATFSWNAYTFIAVALALFGLICCMWPKKEPPQKALVRSRIEKKKVFTPGKRTIIFVGRPYDYLKTYYNVLGTDDDRFIVSPLSMQEGVSLSEFFEAVGISVPRAMELFPKEIHPTWSGGFTILGVPWSGPGLEALAAEIESTVEVWLESELSSENGKDAHKSWSSGAQHVTV